MPMPPRPNTATVEPGVTLAVLSTAPMPVVTPQPSSPKMQHGGRRNCDLGCVASAHLALEVFKVCQLDVLDVANLVDHAHHRWRQFLCAVGSNDRDRDVGLDPTDLLQKIDVEIGAAELSVCNAFQAYVFLKLHYLGNGAVFYQAQLLWGHSPFCFLLTGFKQVLRAQKAAYMVVVGGELGHDWVSLG